HRAPHLRRAPADPRLRRDRLAGGTGRGPGPPGRRAPAVPARGAHDAGGPAVGVHLGAGRGRVLRPCWPQLWRGALMAWVNAIIQGILTGGLYALFACGLSLLFGVMKVVNLAHGDLAVVGAYIGIGVIAVTHMPFLWSIPVVMLLMAVLG